MLQLARALLAGSPLEGETWTRFVLLAGLVGGHASSQSDAARQLWRDHGGRLYANAAVPPFVTLVANWRP